jgi:hypothetical protein
MVFVLYRLKNRLAMNQSKTGPSIRQTALRQFGFVSLCLVVLLGALFWKGFLPGNTIFSNDGPLGAISSACAEPLSALKGLWQDLNWIGLAAPNGSPSFSVALSGLLGPVGFSKLYAPFAMFVVGICAWMCFRAWKFHPMACILGGLATALNSGYFSTACWGVAAQPIAFGMNFLALAALADVSGPRGWLRIVLAGFAVGMGVVEAFDIGAIFSVIVAAFVVFQAFTTEGPPGARLIRGACRLAVVAVFAGFIAAGTVSSLVRTQIQGVAGMEQDDASKARRWDEATMWSLPKKEALGIVIPGLFGFRMDTPQNMGAFGDWFKGGTYWGRIGGHPAWDRYFAANETALGELEQSIAAGSPAWQKFSSEQKGSPPPPGSMRFSGGGCYAGVLVVLVALWTIAQSLRKGNSLFSTHERKFIWFWALACVFFLLLAFGRFAPFYAFFYALPYGSLIRNPAKFAHPLLWSLLILCAYGLNGLCRSYLDSSTETRSLGAQLKSWWAKASAFDRKWVKGSALALVASLLAWLFYAGSRGRLAAHLTVLGVFDGRRPEEASLMAQDIANFSIRQVGWFVLLLACGLGLLVLILGGYFKGRRATFAGVLLGLLLVVDFGAANLPWVIIWNYAQKYASNPVIDFLREKPYEHRAAIMPFSSGLLGPVYDIEWKQQLFQYYNIQSLDVVMMPRPPVDYIGFETALSTDGTIRTVHRLGRKWQLTNTRYLLGPTEIQAGEQKMKVVDFLNQQLDPAQHRFRIAIPFEIVPKPGVLEPTQYSEYTAVTNVAAAASAPYALYEFTGALPRAKLYATWQVSTNDAATLTNLASTTFDPTRTVLVTEPLPPPNPAAATNLSAGTVDFASYAPKRIVLKAKAEIPSVLLLNDRFDPNWNVRVDGKPATLLHCNYLMRGVQVPAGSHEIEFQFEPPVRALYVSLAAVVVALGLIGFLALTCKPPAETVISRPPPARLAAKR